MYSRLHWLRPLAMTVVLCATVSSLTSDAAARFRTLPDGWIDEVAADHWTILSPTDARGGVVLFVPEALPVGGPLPTWLESVARQFASIFVEEPALAAAAAPRPHFVMIRDASGRPQSVLDRSIVSTTYRGRGDGGDKVVQALARLVDAPSGAPASEPRAQVVFVLANAAIADDRGNQEQRWSVAGSFAARLLVDAKLVMTSEALAAALGAESGPPPGPAVVTGPASPQAPTQMAAASPPAADPAPVPSATAARPGLWSARANGDALEIVSPCNDDGVSVVGAVRREMLWAFVRDLQSVLIDDARETLRGWTGQEAQLENIRVEGNLAHGVAWFSAPGRDLVAWFAVTVWQDNKVGRGHVIAPAQASQDRRVDQAIDTVKRMLLDRSDIGLSATGSPPAANASTDVEAVVRLSGLAYSTAGTRLTPTPVPITLFRNGMAIDPRLNLQGRWQRFAGGYAVSFEGGNGYVTRLAETCRTAATVASSNSWQPATPQSAPTPTPAASSGTGASTCGYKQVRVTNYAVICGNVSIGGIAAPATCPAPTSEWRYEWTCD